METLNIICFFQNKTYDTLIKSLGRLKHFNRMLICDQRVNLHEKWRYNFTHLWNTEEHVFILVHPRLPAMFKDEGALLACTIPVFRYIWNHGNVFGRHLGKCLAHHVIWDANFI
ncbi:uncharacterized protein G2W53_039469 [Senna tora]|uniref:Uncharacterized protein n=1 Tax=Senna tora TaxID=362788 RepID=A0A834SMQ3_9FABA|nr:uncharacterized protein G2W53_039469 [Senna tora]